MRLRFVGQPFDQQLNLVDFVEHATSNDFTEIKIAVAWAKKSGLGRVWDALGAFRDQGGHITLILGVSEGGATKEGLELALEAADASYVFHDPRRTFHPKVYFASSSGRRSLLVGSSNLTAGGLGWNYESSLWVDWDADEGEDVTDTVEEWFDKLIAEISSCLPLTQELITQLEASSDIVLGTETRAKRVQKSRSDTPEDNDSTIVATISGLFKPVLVGLRKLPRLSAKIAPAKPSPKPAEKVSPGVAPAPSNDPPLSSDRIQRRWVKELDHTAAQQVKSAKSNPTGNLRLSQEDAPIDHKVYFRDDFFGGLPWTPTEGKESEQEVKVGFRTWIDGGDFGVQDLRVSHDPGRISGQGNVPTVIHWGVLSQVLRETNYIGYYVSLERTDDRDYNLVISKKPRGDYQP